VKRILIVCGTGIATSTVIADKVRKRLAERGLDVKIDQTKVSELHRGAKGYDVIVATTDVPQSIDIPVVKGMPFLTGVGVDKALDDVERHLAD